MDSKKVLIKIDGIDRTKEVAWIGKNYNGTYSIKYYRGEKFYTYPSRRIEYRNLVEENFNDDVLTNKLQYLKEIAQAISVTVTSDYGAKTGLNLLSEQYKKVKNADVDSSLAVYLNPKRYFQKKNDGRVMIFPFGCNSSQYQALKNSLENQISVVQGPPGTGKTQTILNMIANLIIRDQTCQVVSNNNSAIENVEEKLEKYDLDFFVAKLGSNNNKNEFIENQKSIPDLSIYKNIDRAKLEMKIKNIHSIVSEVYEKEIMIQKLKQDNSNISTEYKYFKNYLSDTNAIYYPVRGNSNNLLKILCEIESLNNISFFKKLKFILFNGVGNFKLYSNPIPIIIDSIRNGIYVSKLKENSEKIRQYSDYVEKNNSYKQEYVDLSMKYFKYILSRKFIKRTNYEKQDIKRHARDFLKDYPIVLSTTYSSRNSFREEFKFDYVIMDESSQIDIATGALSLSSAKNAVIIGDEKQLPNVVTNDMRKVTDSIFEKYEIASGYAFSNSFLASVKRIVDTAPVCLLREHYRCHPKIIEFCNKKFYNGDLVVMTEDNNEKDVIKVVRTAIGNHAREFHNEREVEEIQEILKKSQYADIGIIAPYNEQVNLIKNNVGRNIDVSTIHKFQGREKDEIIISTVDNQISKFVDDPNILNVAISRAKKQLILVVTGNNVDNTNLNDFIEYVNYNNFELTDSKIYSIFDFLYKQYSSQRRKYLQEHKKVSEYDSENLMYSVIENELKKYNGLDVICQQPIDMLIRDKSLLTKREKEYASNYLTRLDFLIFNKITKKPVLAIEVDGYKYHELNEKQMERDILKNSILKKYQIPLIRFSTTGSREDIRLRDKLKELNII